MGNGASAGPGLTRAAGALSQRAAEHHPGPPCQAGGGLFRWLSRGLVLGSLLLVLALRYMLDLNIILAAMVGFTVLLVGLLVLWLLVASGRLKIEAG